MTTVTVRSIATGGEGVGRLPDGRAVFIPRTAPGDVVEVEVTEDRRRWARARIRTILESSRERVRPACPHYDADGCGGCQLQHLALPAQHAAKRSIVGDVLARVGGRPVAVEAVTPSPEAWHYRTKLSVAVADGGRTIGFHRHDRPADVFELVECRIAAPELARLLGAVRAARGLLPRAATQLVLRLDRDGGRHVVVRGGQPPWDAEPFAAGLGPVGAVVWWEPDDGAVRALTGGGAFPVLAFQQINPPLADRIRREAVDWLRPAPGVVAWDLYGGVGDAARRLAEAGAAVWSVDADRTAVQWAQRQQSGTDTTITYLGGRAEEVIHRLPEPDVVLLNPPRAGSAVPVLGALEQLARRGKARRVAYVSCDPATLARDLKRLSSFAIDRVAVFDLFPQTAHVETLVQLEAA